MGDGELVTRLLEVVTDREEQNGRLIDSLRAEVAKLRATRESSAFAEAIADASIERDRLIEECDKLRTVVEAVRVEALKHTSGRHSFCNCSLCASLHALDEGRR
jgi:hypothetical protein